MTGQRKPRHTPLRSLAVAGCACALLLGPAARAQSVAPAAPSAEVVPPGPHHELLKRFYLHLNAAFNVYTYVGPLGTKPQTEFTPGSGGPGVTSGRAVVFEQVGFGYLVQEHLRLQLSLVFGEYLTNVPAAPADAFAVAGAIPLAVFLEGPFSLGAGPVLAARSSGVAHFDAGLFVATGWAFQLGSGFTLSPVVQMLAFFYQRTTVGISPCVSLAYRF